MSALREEWDFVQCGHFLNKAGRGSADAHFRTFCCKNVVFFFEIYDVSARTKGKGLIQCGHFSDKEERRSIFRRDFVQKSFIEQQYNKNNNSKII